MVVLMRTRKFTAYQHSYSQRDTDKAICLSVNTIQYIIILTLIMCTQSTARAKSEVQAVTGGRRWCGGTNRRYN